MLVYRICKRKYADDLTGEGAKLFGGRWNNKMVSCVYTSESRALAVLEFTVNVSMDEIPPTLSIVTLQIPVSDSISFDENDLPENWRTFPAPSSTKDFGSNLLLDSKYLIVKIPSVILSSEFNYLINPRHKHADKIVVNNIEDFAYDYRIKS